MEDVEHLAAEFFHRWSVSFEEMCAAFEDVMAPHCRWEQKPMMVTNTRANAVRFLRVSRRLLGLATIEVEIPYMCAVGNVVMTERVDHLLRHDGTVIASAPIAGILEFDGTQLVAWREHFNAIGFASQMPRRAIRRRRRI